ncbi:MAG: alpha/beta hydrolase, partial [Anaerolineae bacterium]
MANFEDGKLETQDGYHLHTAKCIPGTAPKAAVMVVHGYGEHYGRYEHVIDALTAGGYAVYTIDHRGHGKSSGERAYFETIDQPIDDLKAYFDANKSAFPSGKVFMLGHSMGALISLMFALKFQDALNGLVISGVPLTADQNVSPALITAANVLNRIVPKAQLADTAPISELSTDPEVAVKFAADPLTFKGKMRVRMGVAINTGAKWAREHLTTLTIPALMMHGAQDKICPPSGSQLAYDRISSKDKTIKLYPGMKHEIFNEVERNRPISEMIE